MSKSVTLHISGMHCASCATLISRAVSRVEGVENANVNTTTNKASIRCDDKVTTETLIAAILSLPLKQRDMGHLSKSKMIRKKNSKHFPINLLLA